VVKDKDGKRRSTHGRLSPLTEKRLVTLAGHEVIVDRTQLFSVTRAGLQATWHLNHKEPKAEGNSEQIELKWAALGRRKLVATYGDRRVTRIIDVIACPVPACGAAARIVDRWTLGVDRRPGRARQTSCERGHWFTPLVESLAPAPAAGGARARCGIEHGRRQGRRRRGPDGRVGDQEP
jgi:hypothetical protein